MRGLVLLGDYIINKKSYGDVQVQVQVQVYLPIKKGEVSVKTYAPGITKHIYKYMH